jgi:PPOX class probable F420-dependent enzyme
MIPKEYEDLLERPLIGHLATVRPDGLLQSNPSWYHWDGSRLRLSTTKQRQKFTNVTKDPRVALSVTDPENPYRYLEVRGEVESVDDDTDRAFINSMAKRYVDKDEYPWDPPGAERIIIVVRPTATSMSPG